MLYQKSEKYKSYKLVMNLLKAKKNTKDKF